MASHNVTFLPDERSVGVEDGTTIMEAAAEAGIHINNLCGGEGVCGRCRVKIMDGKVRADKHSISLLSKKEITEGYVLACQTRVDKDVKVAIPTESRIEEAQILFEGASVDYSEPEKIHVHRVPVDPMSLFEPLAQKVFLQLEEPSGEDNISDMDRIIRELKRRTDHRNFEISLRCLQGLALKLRENRWKVTATIAKHGDMWRIQQIEPGDTTDCNYGLAIDVGTTTVVVQLVHLKSAKVIGVAGSREKGLDPLHNAVIQNINRLISTLIQEKGINAQEINAIVAAGNTTMSHLLLSLIPCSIRLDPYVPTVSTYPQVPAKELQIAINPEAILDLIPGVASYVGGDIVAGTLACGIADKPETKVLIDVGTNGEIAIGNNEWLVCCSASAGPAFEGGGMRDGMRAARGAIEKIAIDDGQVRYATIGKAKPRGICGSGLIDCLYELARNHIIDAQGKFAPPEAHERLVEGDGETQFILVPPEETESGHALTITQSDINNLIRSKGAVFAAIKSLMDYVGLKFEDLDTLFVAGGFGSYLDIPKAIGIGLLPDIDPGRIRFIGNSSLMGARMCLLSIHSLERAAQIAKSMTNIELSIYQPFMDEYVAAMFLPHTDKRLFPSVDY
jgi:uncharacterized 2Fe-2S/4Fe-4S cluster protein (DUF4445 family)